MSLKRNILANYATQIYVTLISIVILPLYLKYMGAEAYGLVGFFAMLQAWFNLLDMGLTPTVARETARFNGGATDAQNYRRLLRALQIIFFAVAFLGGGIMLLSAGIIADKWLHAQTLPPAQVKIALQLMAVGVALRWICGLYRGCISGAERLVWLSGFNAFVATLRFVGILPILIWVDHSPTVFFTYQLLIAFIEFVGLAIKSRTLLPALAHGQILGWTPNNLFKPIKPILKYSFSIALTSAVWVLLTQIDKMLLSGSLPLNEYGYFTMAVILATGLMTLCAPLTNPITLRMINLYSQNKKGEAMLLYKNSTSMISVLAGSFSIILILFSKEILDFWTGNEQVGIYGKMILSLYAGGYFFAALAAFPGYIQQAQGDLKYHLRGNFLLLIIMIPSMCLSIYFWGAVGAASTWFAVNLFYFLLWTYVTHKNLLPGFHKTWLIDCILRNLIPGITCGVIAKYLSTSGNVDVSGLLLFAFWIIVFSTMIFFSPLSINKIIKQ